MRVRRAVVEVVLAGVLGSAGAPLGRAGAMRPRPAAAETHSNAVGLSPGTLTFGSVPLWTTSAAKTVTVTNNNSSTLSFVSILASGDFAQTNNCGSSLQPGASCTLTVTFTPSAANKRTGYVTLNDTDSSNLQTVNLSGSGTSPSTVVVVSPGVSSLTPSKTEQYTAKVNGVTSTDVTWSVDGITGGNSTVGAISSGGLYTSPSSAGAHSITATNTLQTSQSESARVTITNYAGTFSYHNDAGLTGQNTNETVLTTGNVNSKQFGKVFSFTVDGYVYAEPLYVPGVIVNGVSHNVLYVATENDSLYAFDADGSSKTALWKVSFISPPTATTVPSTADTCTDLVPQVGITGTPVIDPVAGVIYLVASTEESGQYYQRLHALSISSGAEMYGGPVVITASVPGTGAGTSNGLVSFDSLRNGQRPGLTLTGGSVYINWASHCDNDPFHGWTIAYNSQSLQQESVFNTGPNGTRAGIWQGGGATAVDAEGYLYFMTGNGTFDASSGGVDFGDSMVKLSTSGGLSVADYFTPYDQAALETNDVDLGSGGNIVLPDQPGPYPHLIVGVGKEGSIYLVNRDAMGGYNPNGNSQIVQYLPTGTSGMWGMGAYWQNNLYIFGQFNYLQQFRLYNGLLSTEEIALGPTKISFPSAITVVSANGATNGIVWAIDTSAFSNKGPAVLHAYDAANVSRELYNTTQDSSRDQAGPATKFAAPTVANGRVYVGTEAQVNVYGLLP